MTPSLQGSPTKSKEASFSDEVRPSPLDINPVFQCPGDMVVPMYNLIEYKDNYSKTSGSLWQYCKDIPAVDDNGAIVDFNGANSTDPFNFKTKITTNHKNLQKQNNKDLFIQLLYAWLHLTNNIPPPYV